MGTAPGKVMTIITRDVDVSYEKTLIRAVSFLVTCHCSPGCWPPGRAVEYEGVTSLSIDAKSALLIDMDTEQVLYEQAADEQRYPASITKIMTALLTLGRPWAGGVGPERRHSPWTMTALGRPSPRTPPPPACRRGRRSLCATSSTACCWLRPTKQPMPWPSRWPGTSPPSWSR